MLARASCHFARLVKQCSVSFTTITSYDAFDDESRQENKNCQKKVTEAMKLKFKTRKMDRESLHS